MIRRLEWGIVGQGCEMQAQATPRRSTIQQFGSSIRLLASPNGLMLRNAIVEHLHGLVQLLTCPNESFAWGR